MEPANKPKEGESVNLWNMLLEKTIKLEDRDGHIFVLGNYDSAKKSLVAAVEKLMGDRVIIESRNEQSVIFSMKDKKNPGAFDYSYVSIKNPSDETMELAKLNFWILNEKVSDEVLAQIFTEKRLRRMMVMICLDFENPGQLPDNLVKWFTYLNQRMVPAFKLFSLKDMDAFKARLSDLVMNYVEPTTVEGKVLNRKIDVNPELADKLAIPDGVLQPNYGFPILLCMNKADHILELRKERRPDEILELIEYTLRKNAYPYAAGVVYTSPKMGTNIQVVADYIKFLFFSIPYNHPVNQSKESLFIPIGFDNAEIINTAFASSASKNFSEIVPKKEEAPRQADIDVKIKPHQKYLEDLKGMQGTLRPSISRPSTQTSDLSIQPQSSGNISANAAPANEQNKMRIDRERREKILNVLNRNPAGGAPPAPPAPPAQGQ
jgi:hypothetical protein